MQKILTIAKAIVAAIGAAATAVAGAAVPDKWRSIAAIIGAVVTTIAVYLTPNQPA